MARPRAITDRARLLPMPAKTDPLAIKIVLKSRLLHKALPRLQMPMDPVLLAPAPDQPTATVYSCNRQLCKLDPSRLLLVYTMMMKTRRQCCRRSISTSRHLDFALLLYLYPRSHACRCPPHLLTAKASHAEVPSLPPRLLRSPRPLRPSASRASSPVVPRSTRGVAPPRVRVDSHKRPCRLYRRIRTSWVGPRRLFDASTRSTRPKDPNLRVLRRRPSRRIRRRLPKPSRRTRWTVECRLSTFTVLPRSTSSTSSSRLISLTITHTTRSRPRCQTRTATCQCKHSHPPLPPRPCRSTVTPRSTITRQSRWPARASTISISTRACRL